MAIPDYIPPGMRWNGTGFEPVTADNLDNAKLMISQKNAEIDHLREQVKEWENKFADIWSKGIAPVMRVKYEAIEAENKQLKEQLAAGQQTETKARKNKADKQEPAKAEV